LLKYWAQSFIVGVPRIVVGFHEDGIVKEVRHLHTLSIPSQVDNLWNGKVCLNFVDKLLTFLRLNVTMEGEWYTLSFEEPFEKLTLKLGEDNSQWDEDDSNDSLIKFPRIN